MLIRIIRKVTTAFLYERCHLVLCFYMVFNRNVRPQARTTVAPVFHFATSAMIQYSSTTSGSALYSSECEQKKMDNNEASQEALTKDQVERYSRQLLLSEGFGVTGQVKLLNSKVLVIGAGGIGSTVLLYLAAAGVGFLAIADFDVVEVSNLHRQIIHKDQNAGKSKVDSAREAVLDLNPTIKCTTLTVSITDENAVDIIQPYTIVVDASDNPRTRYIINDACVLTGKPLISGSAVGMEGQISVFNHKGSPCYRCLYPRASISSGCHSCSDRGVFGPVPGLIGIFQSIETIKVLTNMGSSLHDRMLMYDAIQGTVTTLKKPPKTPSCPVCGPSSTIRSLKDSGENLVGVRGPSFGDPVSDDSNLPDGVAVTCTKYAEVRRGGKPHVLLDVRVPAQFHMCSLEGAVNIPLSNLSDEIKRVEKLCLGGRPLYCICRRGIASNEAARILLSCNSTVIPSIHHIVGGLNNWHETVDSSFPRY